ncbi:unnamed protein product, partial [Amoebophrya sp. A120]|eukprot:GSA120T00021931001.1
MSSKQAKLQPAVEACGRPPSEDAYELTTLAKQDASSYLKRWKRSRNGDESEKQADLRINKNTTTSVRGKNKKDETKRKLGPPVKKNDLLDEERKQAPEVERKQSMEQDGATASTGDLQGRTSTSSVDPSTGRDRDPASSTTTAQEHQLVPEDDCAFYDDEKKNKELRAFMEALTKMGYTWNWNQNRIKRALLETDCEMDACNVVTWLAVNENEIDDAQNERILTR